MNKNEIPSYAGEFLDYLATIKGRSANTVRSYYYDLKSFLRFLKIKNGLVDGFSGNVADIDSIDEEAFQKIEVDDLSEEYVKKVDLYILFEFLHFLAKERGNCTRARYRRAVAIRRFFKYLTTNKQWFEISPAQDLELPGGKPLLPKSLSYEQAIELLGACEYDNTWMGARDYCIMTFFLNCGMRLSELVGLNMHDFKKEKLPEEARSLYIKDDYVHYLRVLGKGKKERIVYLNSACVDAYNNYLIKRGELALENERAKFEKAMFFSKFYKRISPRRVEQIIEEKLRVCGLDGLGYSVHKLRHTAATLMYHNGVDIRVLKEVLGHENLGTTQIYTKVINDQMRDAVYNNPLSKINDD